jgi:YHS domain-containing protein
MARKLFAQILGHARQAPSAGRRRESREVIPLHRDPWCGTYVSAEISFPFEQSGQVLHFCSQECRARYQRSARRAASA